MSKPIHITQETFDAEVLQSRIPVLVDFWADWCPPCHKIAPIIDDLARDYEGVVKVGKVDVDAHPDLADRYGIASIPTQGYFRNGQLVDRFVGYKPKQEMKRLIEAARARCLRQDRCAQESGSLSVRESIPPARCIRAVLLGGPPWCGWGLPPKRVGSRPPEGMFPPSPVRRQLELWQ